MFWGKGGIIFCFAININWGVGVVDDFKALVHHVGIATVRVRILSGSRQSSYEKGLWADPCTEGAPMVRQDLSGRPAM